jgi:hypothetical protein
MTNPGEDKAWNMLASMRPDAVCRAASVSYDRNRKAFRLQSFGMDFDVSLTERSLASDASGSDVLLQRLGSFFRLSALWYLVHAKDIPPTGRLVKLTMIRGGDIFSKGSHVLPLEPLALKFGKDRAAYLNRGKVLAGVTEPHLADVALRLFPLPRIPVVLALWLEDQEFPARADLLFDSTCELQVPTDIIWSIAMMSVLVMTGVPPMGAEPSLK